MTTLRLPLALAFAALAVGAAVTASDVLASDAPERTLADYCVIVGPIYYEDMTLFGGGRYCIPAP